MSKKRYDTKVHANERDREIFEFIGKHGCANATQIHASLFDSRTLGRAKDRLNQLVKGGYLQTEITVARGKRERMYWIERKALMEFDKNKRDLLERGRPPDKELSHTLNMVDVCNKVEKNHVITSFIHEHGLKSLKARDMLNFVNNQEIQVGDRVISVLPLESGYLPGGDYMVEIDGDYWGAKLAHKLRSLQASGMDVIYVCFNGARYNYVKSHLNHDSIQVFHIDEL